MPSGRRTVGISLVAVGAVAMVLAILSPLLLRDATVGLPERVGASAKLTAPVLPPSTGPQPKFEVDKTNFYMGEMLFGEEYFHIFKVRNAGKAPLEIRATDTSCVCLKTDLVSATISPGETLDVRADWEVRDATDEFEQSITVLTNDATKPKVILTVSGSVPAGVKLDPPELTISSLSSAKETTAEFLLYTRYEPAPKIGSTEWRSKSIERYFSVEHESLTRDEVPIGFSNGYRFKLRIAPGMPYGPFKQIALFSSDHVMLPAFPFTIYGDVQGDISLIGPKWNSNLGLLQLGKIDVAEGLKLPMKLLIRGEHRHEVKIGPPKVSSDVVQVTVGEMQDIEGSPVVQVPFEITIPPGSRQVSHMGSTADPYVEITFPTNHDSVPDFLIRAQFATVGD